MPQTQTTEDDCASFYGMLTAVRLRLPSNVALSGLQNFQGETGADGDRVLLTGQTAPLENGIWVMRPGAWERAVDCEDGDELGANLCPIELGDNAAEVWQCTNRVGAGFVGTDALAFSPFLRGSNSGFFSDAVLVWNLNGNLSEQDEIDGRRGVVGNGTIIGITIGLERRGRNGDTIIDVKKHTVTSPPLAEGDTQFDIDGNTIYGANPGNRPIIAGSGNNANRRDNAIHRAIMPDDITFMAGDYFTIEIVSRATQSRDLSVMLSVRYNNG